MILITGATGHFGKSTIDFLLKKQIPASNISALVRDQAKAGELSAKGISLRMGNYDDYKSLVNAFRGVDRLLFVSGNDVVNRLNQHKNVVLAAQEAGVKHVIYTSFFRKNETENSPLGMVASSHIETDNMIKNSGIPFTIMLNNLYAEVLPMFFGDKVLDDGIFLPAGDGKAAYTARTDMAEAAANILSTTGHENKTYVIANTQNYTMYDAASILSELTGKTVSYLDPTSEMFANTLSRAGVPVETIGFLKGFCEAIKQGEFETENSELEQLIGRKPTSLKDFLKSIYTFEDEKK